jgi:pSer/pThr/pTyr-binding forkhead associated (FHA) protein
MIVRLVQEKGKSRKTLRLQSEESIVGRRHDCDVRIISAEVSRRHCLLSIFDGYLNVEDLDSVNGTFLNGKRVAGKQIVRPGDRLQIGPAEFVVEYELTQATLDRIQELESGAEVDEDLEAIAVVEEEDGLEEIAFPNSDTDLGDLPLAEEVTSLHEGNSADEPEADDQPIPVAEEFDAGENWHLPQDNDIRDLLSQMDDSKEARPTKKRRS